MRDCIADLSEKKEREFLGQFKDSIQAVAAGLKAGYSVENAIRGAGRDIEPLYGPDKKDPQGIQPDDPTAGHEYVNRCSPG